MLEFRRSKEVNIFSFKVCGSNFLESINYYQLILIGMTIINFSDEPHN
jgi:hypothetical protein